MVVHKWRKRPTRFFGDVWVPFAQIELQGSDGRFHALALQIDSGAVVSLLRRSASDLLAIELESGRRIEVTGVGDSRTVAFVHELQTRFSDTIVYKVPFAIATTEKVPNLLGRLEVFGPLQVDFDGTLEETRISAPWLTPEDRRIWNFLLESSEHILARWVDMELPDRARDVARRFIDRAAQVLASAVGLMKLHRCYAAPALIRTLFELAMQFEYLMNDLEDRARRYSEFAHITQHRHSSAIAQNPTGFVSKRFAQSPLRAEGEKRNKEEFERVRPMFSKGKNGVWDKWYCMTTHNLAKEVGWLGDYRVVFAACSAWAHGDPFSTEQMDSHTFAKPDIVFVLCTQYYARMLLKLADRGNVLLSSEQYDGLRAFTSQWA